MLLLVNKVSSRQLQAPECLNLTSFPTGTLIRKISYSFGAKPKSSEQVVTDSRPKDSCAALPAV